MPIGFEHVDVVTVRAPDGRWFDVRIVVADGHRAWSPAWRIIGFHAVWLALYGLYRAAVRLAYVARRSTLTAVEVVPAPEGEATPPQVDHREVLPDRPAARRRAEEIRSEIESGALAL